MFSGQERCGGYLPQNVQNGFAVTEHTEGIGKEERFGFQCIPCAAGGGFRVLSGQNSAEGVYHRMHRMAYRPTQNTQKVLGVWCDSDFSVFRVPRSGFSVFSGQTGWNGFVSPPNTQNGFAVTEHTEGIGTEEIWISVCSVCRRRRFPCVQWPRRHGGDLPQNAQNGLSADTEHTESVGGVVRLGFQCIQCAAGGGFSVFSGKKKLCSVK